MGRARGEKIKVYFVFLSVVFVFVKGGEEERGDGGSD